MHPTLPLLLGLLSAAAVTPSDILPKGVKYDPKIPTPASHVGFAIGERHLEHHQIAGYLKKLAGSSERVKLHEYAHSHGGRPLLVLTITSPENHRRLEEIRRQHLQLADPRASAGVKLNGLPAVIWMGYGVHGNEPSASNVAPLVAYHLAAGVGEEHERLLREVVVLLDPCLNPDGFDRFARWANDLRGAARNPDPDHREHKEAWPGGRTNHYWFDLNRDWLPAQQPESRGRLAVYHQWKPNVVLDFHEMGATSTYFFQPGAPKRTHPLIPKANQELTRALAKGHAAALDRIGSLYFTEELFDDYYPGKGSTYPDLHGGVGILFEQAGARGLAQDTPNGTLSFPFTIRNQLTTSLSSLRGTLALRERLLEYKRAFYHDARERAGKLKAPGYVVAAKDDPARLHEFLRLLHAHDIRAYRLKGEVSGGPAFRPGEAYVIPGDQPEAVFLQALFETRTEFAENIFYDVSAWTLPLAFNLQYAPVNGGTERLMGEPFNPAAAPARPFEPGADDLAYLIDWRCCHAPRALARLLAGDVKVRMATAPFKARQGDETRPFGHGTVMVPLGIQPEKREAVVRALREAARDGVAIYPLTSGLTEAGINLGSPAFLPVRRPKVALVTGEGVTAYEAGEVWHLLDRRVGMPVTMLDTHRLGSVELDKYTAVVLVSGAYQEVPASGLERLKQFAERGGTLIAIGTSINWLEARKVVAVPLRRSKYGLEMPAAKERRPYAQAEEDAAQRLIRGAIFRTRADPTHPIAYGLPAGESLPVCRSSTVMLNPSDNPYCSPVVYEDRPLLSGYVSAANLDLLAGSASIVVVPAGKGRVVLMADNPNFRAFWYGTDRLFTNAVFFGPITQVPKR